MNALLEIGLEHLPARFMAPALKQLETLTAQLLDEKRIAYKSVKFFKYFLHRTYIFIALISTLNKIKQYRVAIQQFLQNRRKKYGGRDGHSLHFFMDRVRSFTSSCSSK